MCEETTDEIELNMAGLAMFPREWAGVFAADETPPRRGYCVQNTAPRASGGVHRLARADGLVYDSHGRRCEAEVRRSLWRYGTKERRNELRADVPRVAVCAQGVGRWSGATNLINFAGLCRLVCARRRVRRSRLFWGGRCSGHPPAHHPALHFFEPGPNNKTGRGGGRFYVGSI